MNTAKTLGRVRGSCAWGRKGGGAPLYALYEQWNWDFWNLHFFEPPDNWNQQLFPLLSQTL